LISAIENFASVLARGLSRLFRFRNAINAK
jgi:hypothetical protein